MLKDVFINQRLASCREGGLSFGEGADIALEVMICWGPKTGRKEASNSTKSDTRLIPVASQLAERKAPQASTGGRCKKNTVTIIKRERGGQYPS